MSKHCESLDESNKTQIQKSNHENHLHARSSDQPFIGKNSDGTWGPTGLYGGRVKETPLLKALRDAIKPSRLLRVEDVLQARCKRVQCLFENLSDPANGAACLRTMEGFGLLEAHAVEAYEPFKVQGGITMNADKWMQVHKYRHCLDAANEVKQRGHTLIAACLDKDAVPINQIDFASMGKICVMFGNEERGLSWALRNIADFKMYIPMVGFSQSFNISVSCAMSLFHLREQGVISPDLDDDELNDFYLKWLLMSTKRAATIVRKKKLEKLAPDYI